MKAKWNRLMIQGIAFFLGFTFFGAGMAKLYAGHSYFGWIGPVWLIERLEEHSLGLFGKFIALCQIVIGYLLMTTRYKLLGSIMMIPMILNILMITISQQWKGTPFVLAFLLILDLILIWHYRDFFWPLLNESIGTEKIKTRAKKSILGHLIWLSGLSLQFISIAVSFNSLPIAYLTSLAGIVLSVCSFLIDSKTTSVS